MIEGEMLISVIVPTYRPGEYLWECLDSLCAQTLNRNQYEIIIVLNGCNEPFLQEIRDYIANHQDLLLSLVQIDEPGVSNARNIGIDKSCGEYITFVDDDDIISPTYLKSLLSVSSDTCVGCANSFFFEEDLSKKTGNFITAAYARNKKKTFSSYSYRQFLSPPVCKLIHRSIIGDNRFPTNLKRSEDSVFCMKIARNIRDMKLANEDCIYYIRKRFGSATRKKEASWSLLSELLDIEWTYLKVWLAHPFSYNVKFVLSRMYAAVRNTIGYLKSNT